MTQDDCVLLAKAFALVRRIHATELKSQVDPMTWHLLRTAVADALAGDNPLFDIKWFYSACGELHVPLGGRS